MKRDIPDFLSHLPVDERGYPVPSFVPMGLDGKPNFKFVDNDKRKDYLDRKLCGVCGKKLDKKEFWFIGGPLMLKNRAATDIPMHQKCARASLVLCPYLFNKKADRVSTGDEIGVIKSRHIVEEKPPKTYLILADQVEWFRVADHGIYRFRAVRAYEFHYVDNILTESGVVERFRNQK